MLRGVGFYGYLTINWYSFNEEGKPRIKSITFFVMTEKIVAKKIVSLFFFGYEKKTSCGLIQGFSVLLNKYLEIEIM
jgi:hypothetical protein